MYLPLLFLLLPFAIVGFWKKRPVIALSLATFLSYLILIIPALLQTFQAMMIYGEGDPELMAGGISQALISSSLTLLILFPALVLFQFILRRRRHSKA